MSIDKGNIRKEIKKLKALLTEDEQQSSSVSIRRKIESLNHFKEAHNILLYYSLPDEVCTHPWLDDWDKTKKLFLPVVVGDYLEVKPYKKTGMQQGAYNIIEPQGPSISNLSLIDLVIVPGVVFDHIGNRIGRGKGYYDRLLPQLSAPLIGVAYDCQIIEHIPTESHDIAMDMIITPNKIY